MSRRTPHSPDRDEQVRRWLAAARHTEPMPEEVAERMDRVLSGLAAEPSREATVVRLADRRRRAATLLVAAAAVVVGGVGVAQVVGGGIGPQAETALDSSPAEEEAAVEGRAAAPEAAAGGRRELTDDLADRRPLVSIRPRSFAEDAAAVRDRVLAAYQSGSSFDETEVDGQLSAKRQAVCEPGAWGRGSYRAVSYDGAPGYLVFRRPRGDTQVADLFLCGSEVAVRSVTLPR